VTVNVIPIVGLTILAVSSTASLAGPFDGYRPIDLTHSFDENTIYWPTENNFRHEEAFKGNTEGGWYYTAYSVHTAEHGGTHLDAPIHFAQGTWSADEIPLSSLITPVVVIDVSTQALANADFRLSVQDIQRWEAEHGEIPERATVLMNIGYARFWPDRLSYMGTDLRGPEGVAALHFPGFSEASARFLYEQRAVVAVGLDTPSIDYGQSKDFIVHQYLYAKNVIGLENIADLSEVPATGAWLLALPMKIRDGSGGPLRLVALVPQEG
jgi:kynurenine formamidase